MAVQKLAIFFDGTWANKDYNALVYPVLTATNSLIAQLYNEFQGDKFYCPGPGTSNRWGWFGAQSAKNWLAGAGGDIGDYGVQQNVDAAYQRVVEALNGLAPDDQLDLHCCGWSRGAVANFRLLHKLKTELPPHLQAKIKNIQSFNIDPVCGGPSDRGSKFTQLASLSVDDEFTRKIQSTTFYSDTGGLHASHYVYRRTPIFFGTGRSGERARSVCISCKS
ncbi:phospholipase effector Tle1 domain-containing protein [Piscirickettsia litoralis]|uniref:DUF2235 domain-containing protein n=1 Tax=Piscirickettsia litoralis TaxID=1891921 RepID=A0ABX3A252_9GAMM|nr:DUF2235 domain-containing protein [Piscirickettsia litoralis]ODN41708.1 hypothetical protein BGC07_00305 [Piscirickettsia litoralis]